MTVRHARTLCFLLYLFLVAWQFSPDPAFAQQLSPTTAFKLLLCLKAEIEKPPSKTRTSRPGAKRTIEAADRKLTVAWVTRAQNFHPEMDPDQVEGEVRSWIESQRASFDLHRNHVCGRTPEGKVDQALTYFKSDAFASAMLSYGTGEVAYDKQLPLVGNKGLLTYAPPGFQVVVLRVIKEDSKKDCSQMAVDSIVLNHRQIRSATNMPLFVKAPINYQETWRVTCGTATKDTLVNFSRDSDGLKGLYSITPVRD